MVFVGRDPEYSVEDYLKAVKANLILSCTKRTTARTIQTTKHKCRIGHNQGRPKNTKQSSTLVRG